MTKRKRLKEIFITLGKYFLSHSKCILYAKKINLEDISDRDIAYKIICPDYFDPNEIKNRYVNVLTGALSVLIKNTTKEFNKVKHPIILNNLSKLFPNDEEKQIQFLYRASLIVNQVNKNIIKDDINWFEPQIVYDEFPLILHLLKNYEVSPYSSEQLDFPIGNFSKNNTNLSLFCSLNIKIDIDRITSMIEENFGLKIKVEDPYELKEIPKEFIFYKFTRIPHNEEHPDNYRLIILDSTDCEFIIRKIPGKDVDAILTTKFPVYINEYPLYGINKAIIKSNYNTKSTSNITSPCKKVKDIFTDSNRRKGYVSLIEPHQSSKLSLILGKLNFIATEGAEDQNFSADEILFQSTISFGANHLIINEGRPIITSDAFLAFEYDFVKRNWWLIEKAKQFGRKVKIESSSGKKELLPQKIKSIYINNEERRLNCYDLSEDNGFYITISYDKNISTEDKKILLYAWLGTGHGLITSMVTEITEDSYLNYAKTILGKNTNYFSSASEGFIYKGKINGETAYLKIYDKIADWSTIEQKEFFNDIIKHLLYFSPTQIDSTTSFSFQNNIYLDIKKINDTEKVVTLMPEFKILAPNNIKQATKKIPKIIDFIRHCNKNGFYCFDILLHEEEKKITSNWAEDQNKIFNIDLGAYYKINNQIDFERYRDSFKSHNIPQNIDPNVWQMYLLGVLIYQIMNNTTLIPNLKSKVELSGKESLKIFINDLIGGNFKELDQYLINELKKKLI